MTGTWFRLFVGVTAAIAAPATAKPVGFALIDIEGAEADQIARLPRAEAAAYVATLVARRPTAIIVNTVLDSTPDEQEARFVTPPPKGVIPRKGVPASVYIVKHQYDSIAIWGRLEYRDFTRKTPSPIPPAGVGYRIDRKSFRESLLDDRPRMILSGSLTRNRRHGSRYLVSVFQSGGPVKAADLAKADATFSAGLSH